MFNRSPTRDFCTYNFLRVYYLWITEENFYILVTYMAHITREDVLKLAQLSKLELSEEQIERFTKDIGAIVEYVEHLQSADVDGLEPTDQVTRLVNAWREDEEIDYQAKPKDLLKNAPAIENNQVRVKRVIE